jgi:hypothetical protein
MGRAYLYLFIFVAAAMGTCARLPAQADPYVPSTQVKTMPAPSDGDGMPALRVKQLPAPGAGESVAAFSSEQTNPLSHSIQIISEAEMTRADRDLVADAQSSIQERAGFENLEFDNGGWIYHELVCPALPNHLFLRFTRDDGTRQMSMFSASIPRDGNGRVHIIPIVRKGYSLFSPAPVGALTIAAFNRIRTEESDTSSGDWLGTGLCYAALAGANPQTPASAGGDSGEAGSVLPPTLMHTAEGGAIIRFADVSTLPKAMEWTLTFTSTGKLMHAEHRPASIERSASSKAGVDRQEPAKP